MARLMMVVVAALILAVSGASAQQAVVALKLVGTVTVYEKPDSASAVVGILGMGRTIIREREAPQGWHRVWYGDEGKEPRSSGYVTTSALASAMPASADVANNPCADDLYQRLKSRGLADLNEREYEYFMQRDRACVEYQRTLAEVGPQQRAVEEMEKTRRDYTAWIILSAVASAVFYLIAVN